MSVLSMLPSSEVKASTMNMLLPMDLVTVTPLLCTASGSIASPCETLFCTCTWAVSGSVPESKVRVIEAVPAELLLEDMYSRWSRPVICCSRICVTEFCTVSAEAPV